MNNCIEFSDLISAFNDGELTESDRRRVEDHLDLCESCSTLLALYSEISSSVVDAMVPAPDILRSRVMENVLSENAGSRSVMNIVPETNKANRRKHIRVLLQRYAPVAACLAVMLLALPWIINSYSHKSYSPAPPQAVQMESQLKKMDKVAENNVAGVFPASGGNDGAFSTYSDDIEASSADSPAYEPMPTPTSEPWLTAPAPNLEYPVSSAQDVQPEHANDSVPDSTQNFTNAPPDAADTTALPDNIGRAPAEADDGLSYVAKGTIAPGEEPSPAPAPAPAPSSSPSSTSAPDATPEESSETENSVGYGAVETPQPPSSSINKEGQAVNTPDYISGLLDSFTDAYAWIEITGELPTLLTMYDSIPLDGLSNWEAYYKISRSVALDLIKETSFRDNVSVTYNNHDSGYAIVVYSSGS